MFHANHQQLVFPTSDLISNFSSSIGLFVDERDAMELFHQLFAHLGNGSPVDMYDRDILDLSRFVFLTQYPSIQEIPTEVKDRINKAAYAVLVQLHVRAEDTQTLNNEKYKDYLPYLMIGNDVCLKQYRS